MNVCPYPIAVMSFNRPNLLREVLRSLRSQTVSVDESRIYLFQDGAQSRFTPIPADDSLQNECISRFREIFPNGQVLQSPFNLGVALNFDRAERLFFETLEAECGLFFEDDLVLSPHYLDALLQLTDFALSEPLVSCVAAYGYHRASPEQQRLNSKRIIRMIHNWGFSITRRQWLQQKDIVEGYLSIVHESEYARRDHNRIDDYFASFGFAWAGTSQDCAKGVAGLVLGTTRLMCFPCFGHYIGQEGVHSTPENYAHWGYANTTLFDYPPPQFDLPTRAQLVNWIDDERKLSRERLAAPPETSRAIDLLVQTSAIDYVTGLYQSLLGRSPDERGLDTWLAAIRTGYSLSDVANAFVESTEFQCKFSAALPAAAKGSRMNTHLDTAAISERVKQYPWFHSIDLGNGIVTVGRKSLEVHAAESTAFFDPIQIEGATVIDIGAWNGFYSFEAKRRGAKRVLATDHFCWNDEYFRGRETFDLARSALGLDIEAIDIDIPSLSPEVVGKFDVVLFLGVFYHLFDPIDGLRRAASLAKEVLVVETHTDLGDLDRPAMVMYPGAECANDPTNWWGPNNACIRELLKTMGFVRIDGPAEFSTRAVFHAWRSTALARSSSDYQS